jgi:hypothetical protein
VTLEARPAKFTLRGTGSGRSSGFQPSAAVDRRRCSASRGGHEVHGLVGTVDRSLLILFIIDILAVPMWRVSVVASHATAIRFAIA